jgi:hypothetical protein
MAEANESRAPGERLGAWLAPGGRFARLYQSAWQPWFLVAGLALGATLVRFALHLHVPLPFCMLRRVTGVPCPACGSTRSLIAWTHFDPLEAFLFNPLFFVLTLGVAGWAGAVLADRWCGTRWLPRLQTLQGRWFSLRLLIPLIVANWLYLCLTLPK